MKRALVPGRRITAVAVLLLAACTPADDAATGAGSSAAGASETTGDTAGGARGGSGNSVTATSLGATQGFQRPESVRYDSTTDVFFVSNINGHPARKDNNGWIGRVSAGQRGNATVFIAGGRDDVYLHAPKGMAIQGDTLWVADIDLLRGFDKHTGKFIRAVGFWQKNVAYLNDVVVGGDGALYLTDTGVTFDAAGEMQPSTGGPRIYRLAGHTTMTEELKGDVIAGINGITFDWASSRFLLAPFEGTEIKSWQPGALPERYAAGPGGYDGIEIANGRVYVSSWTDSSVHVVENGTTRPIIRNVTSPADIGIDTRRNVIAVPRFEAGRVEYYQIR